MKRQHMDFIAERGHLVSFHCGLVHKPVSNSRSIEDTGSQSRRGSIKEQIKNFSVGCQDVKSTVKRKRMETQFAYLKDLRHLKNAELATHLWNTRGELCSGETTSVSKQYCGAKCFSVPDGNATFLDTILKLLGVAGEASDAIPA